MGHARPVLPTDVPDPRAVLAAFGLPGTPVAMDEVAGAWSNRVLRLRTTTGDYAVKELRNPWGEPRWREWLDEGWRLELAALAAGVAVPEPVRTADGGCLAEVPRADGAGTVPVRVHRWVEAATVPPGPVAPAVARWVGRTLAQVHRLALRPTAPDLYAGRAWLTSADVWPGLVARAAAVGAPWTEPLARAEPVARRASALLVPWDAGPEVLCHADVDPSNLLLSATGPRLCDWDVVLPRLASQDLAHAAVTMASWRAPDVAAAVVAGYRDAGGGVPRLRPTDLGPSLAARLGWIRFTVDRALEAEARGSTTAEAADVPDLLVDLAHRVAVAESLDRWPG